MSTSFSATSPGSMLEPVGMKRIATSTPSVVKLALLSDEEMRMSVSGLAAAKRERRGASHFDVRPGDVLTTSTRSFPESFSPASAWRMWRKPVCKPG
jgi:hypothetical protein